MKNTQRRFLDLQIAIDGQTGQVDDGTVDWTRRQEVTEDCQTEPVAGRSAQIESAKVQHVGDRQQQATAEVHQVLVEYQQAFLVLAADNHCVEDKRIGNCSDQAYNDHSALEIEVHTVDQRRRHFVDMCCESLVKL